MFNETINYYRYFDVTKQAEFLYDCANDTIENIIPLEINYLQKYDASIGMAVAIHEGSTLIVVLNALRLLRYKDH